jgi:hypothetical protein
MRPRLQTEIKMFGRACKENRMDVVGKRLGGEGSAGARALACDGGKEVLNFAFGVIE